MVQWKCRIAISTPGKCRVPRWVALTIAGVGLAFAVEGAHPTGGGLSFATRSNLGIYTVRNNGTRLRSIVPDAQPWSAWSVNGRIAFMANTPGARSPSTGIRYQFAQIYTARPDGSGRRQITRDPWYSSESPEWSPHATKLAYHSYPGEINNICIIGADGRGRRQVTYRGGRRPSTPHHSLHASNCPAPAKAASAFA